MSTDRQLKVSTVKSQRRLSTVSDKLREGLRYKFLWAVSTAVITIVALYELLRAGQQVVSQFDFSPIQHLIGFGLLALWYSSLFTGRAVFFAMLWLFFIASGSELAQHLMALGRTGDWKDVGANCIGIGIGFGLSLTVLGRWPLWTEQILRQGRGE